MEFEAEAGLVHSGSLHMICTEQALFGGFGKESPLDKTAERCENRRNYELLRQVWMNALSIILTPAPQIF